MSTYCEAARGHPVHGPYHDLQYGFPLEADELLFERLTLEINQAGLSWLTILKKQSAFRRAYHGFDVDRVAAYGPSDRQRLLADAGIIRNRLKIDATITNAQRIQRIRDDFGSFRIWLDAHHPLPLTDWLPLFRATFRFMGGEIVNEFLMSTGYLAGAHHHGCPVYPRVLALQPPWASANRAARP